jgi:hypothetical protein
VASDLERRVELLTGFCPICFRLCTGPHPKPEPSYTGVTPALYPSTLTDALCSAP